MKNLLFAVLLLLPFLAFSQPTEYQEFYNGTFEETQQPKVKKTKTFPAQSVIWNFNPDKPISETDLQFEYVRYCQYHQFKQRRFAYALWGAGIVTAASPLVLKEFSQTHLQFTQNISIAATVLNLAALMVFVDSDKWMKYASFKPSQEGASIIIRF